MVTYMEALRRAIRLIYRFPNGITNGKLTVHLRLNKRLNNRLNRGMYNGINYGIINGFTYGLLTTYLNLTLHIVAARRSECLIR